MPAINPWRKMPVHRIGTYTEHGLTPELVESFLSQAREAGCGVIVDPFIGSGVVAVEAQKRCLDVIGIDANPWSLTLTCAKTTKINSKYVLSKIEDYSNNLMEIEPFIPSTRLSRYYDPLTLVGLGRIRRIIEFFPENTRPLLLATFMPLAYKYSRVKRSPAPRFDKTYENNKKVDSNLLFKEYLSVLKRNLSDLENHEFCGTVTLFLADSSRWLPRKICAVITSPPFANNIDYIRHTMIELLWSGYARDSEDLGALRSMQIPACEACARSWREKLNDPELQRLLSKIKGKRARGYKNYLAQYFYAMSNHFKLLSESLEWRAWYTIGDSIIGGIYIPTHRILANIIRNRNVKVEIRELGNRVKKYRKLYLIDITK